jgi:hypothetical protein
VSVRRPLNIVRASEGKPFFQLFDSALAVCRDDFDVAPDVIVFPCAKIKQVLPAPETLPREAWARVIDGRCLVVFDASTDGNVHTPDGSGRLHDYLASAGVSPQRAAYITQDRSWEKAYREHTRRFGLRQMRVAYYDYFLRSFFKDFETTGDVAYEKRYRLFAQRPVVRSRKYICLNQSPLAAKVLLLARLMKAGLFDAGYISFGGFDETRHSRAVSLKVMLGMIAELPGFGPIAGELMPYVYEMTRLEPMLLGEPKRVEGQPQHVKKQAADRQFDEYSDSFFTIVTETELNSRRISEKPLKSLVNFQPSIILGNPGSVAFTRELGFQSFDGYVDEAYDTQADPAARFEMVAAECLRLCALPDAELWRLEREWTDVLVHNARFGLKKLPTLYRDKFDLRLVEQLATMFEMDEPWLAPAEVEAA